VGGAQPAGGQAPAAKQAARRFRWASPATATILGALALVVAAATATLTGLAHQLTIRGLVSVSVLVVIYAGVGLVVARRQPRNPIGWMLLIFTLLYLFDGGAAYYAVLHYRLGYRELLAYALVTGLLVGVYAGLVLLATQVFELHSTVSVAVATLAAAALFTPVRRRVQRIVDRRFNRARYDADRTVAAFASRLQDAVDLDTIRGDLATVVQQALEPASLSMWTNEPG
jgi:hypothetical protein